ncbi:MAG TPA: histidine phosphatase family protein [Gemmatimonadales bacterium]
MPAQLLLIRHAIAEDRTVFARTGQPDGARPLTGEGRAKMREHAEALRALVPRIDLLATSPFVRARQTADIVAGTYGIDPIDADVLAHGGDPADFIAWADAAGARGVVAGVGHEPDLSHLAAYCVTGSSRPLLVLKKGAACLLTFPDTISLGGGSLDWLLTPKQLRLIARGR